MSFRDERRGILAEIRDFRKKKKAPTDQALTADKVNLREADGGLGLNSLRFIPCKMGCVA